MKKLPIALILMTLLLTACATMDGPGGITVEDVQCDPWGEMCESLTPGDIADAPPLDPEDPFPSEHNMDIAPLDPNFY